MSGDKRRVQMESERSLLLKAIHFSSQYIMGIVSKDDYVEYAFESLGLTQA